VILRIIKYLSDGYRWRNSHSYKNETRQFEIVLVTQGHGVTLYSLRFAGEKEEMIGNLIFLLEDRL